MFETGRSWFPFPFGRISLGKAYHRDLLRDSVGGSEVCCRLDTHLLYHEGKVLRPGDERRSGRKSESQHRNEQAVTARLGIERALWNHRGMNKRLSTINRNPSPVLPPRGLRIMDAANYMGVTPCYVEVRSRELAFRGKRCDAPKADTPKGNDVQSDKHFEHSRPTSNHCLRRSGTERAWFLRREEAEHFAASPANPAYLGDIAHQCAKCGFYHLSRPEWLEPKFTSADLQMLEDAGIETPHRLDEHFPLLYLWIRYARRHRVSDHARWLRTLYSRLQSARRSLAHSPQTAP
jgi:hypothetical protein